MANTMCTDYSDSDDNPECILTVTNDGAKRVLYACISGEDACSWANASWGSDPGFPSPYLSANRGSFFQWAPVSPGSKTLIGTTITITDTSAGGSDFYEYCQIGGSVDYQYGCDANYYSKNPMQSTSMVCEPCPQNGRSPTGTTAISECYINGTFDDSIGSGRYDGNCYW